MSRIIKFVCLFAAVTSSTFIPNTANAYSMYCTRSSLPGFDTLICTFSWTFAESLLVERRRQHTNGHSATNGTATPLHTTGGVGSPYENTHYAINPGGLTEIDSSGWLEFEDGDESGQTWWESLYMNPAEDDHTSLFP